MRLGYSTPLDMAFRLYRVCLFSIQLLDKIMLESLNIRPEQPLTEVKQCQQVEQHYCLSKNSRISIIARRAVCVMAIAVCSACTDSPKLDILNSAIPAIGYEVQTGIAYGDLARQKMDIYHPNKPAEHSRVIVFVFGGAWRTGERRQYEFVGQALSSAGHTVVIPDYRLYPETTFPGFVDDVVAAIDTWLMLQTDRTNKSALAKTDNALNIVLMGHSSGAHTAALLASDPSWLEATNVTVTELVALSGPYDLPLDDPEVAPVFAGATPESVQPNKLATRCHPRTLLLHGSKDERVLPKHSKTYASALQALDVEVELILLEGDDHAAPVAGLAAPLRLTSDSYDKVVQFLAQPDNTTACDPTANG